MKWIKRDYYWNLEESMEAMKLMEPELERLHNLLMYYERTDTGFDSLSERGVREKDIERTKNQIEEINKVRVEITRRIAGLEY